MNAPVIHDASDLAQTVQRARALLDDGDVMKARMLAAGAYDHAKAASGYAQRIGAGEQLVDKARRLQGDALLIETRAKIRIAEEWDAAQAAGLASTGGRPKTVAGDDGFTAEQAGLTRQDIHEARKLAAAERNQPGIVERAIAARIAARLEPSRANLRAAVGTATASAAERGANLYETPIEAVTALLCLERFRLHVLEPACGKGAILRPLEAAGYDVAIADVVDYGTATWLGEVQRVEDFCASAALPERPDIVTNPPYGASLNAFVAHALRVHRPRKMALLLNLNFLCGFDDPNRCFAMDECPPSRIHVFTRRLPMMHRDGWDGPEASSRMNTAWFVWELERGAYRGLRQVTRIDWQDFTGRQARPPLPERAVPGSRMVSAGEAP